MRAKYGLDVVTQDDNAPWHTANIIKNYLADKTVKLDVMASVVTGS